MEKKIVDYIRVDNVYIVDFVSYDDSQDFLDIKDIITGKIKPDGISYYGLTDMHGEFEKDGIEVNLEFNDMLGNYFEYKGVKSAPILEKIKGWGDIVFQELQKRDQAKTRV